MSRDVKNRGLAHFGHHAASRIATAQRSHTTFLYIVMAVYAVKARRGAIILDDGLIEYMRQRDGRARGYPP